MCRRRAVVGDLQMADIASKIWIGGKKGMHIEYMVLQVPPSKIDNQPLEENLLTRGNECLGYSGQCL